MRPRFTRLLDWVEGRLDEAESREVEALLAEDENARETVEWIREFRRVGRSGTLEEPPSQVRAELRSMFRRLHTAPDEEGELSFDTRSARIAGVRSAAVDTDELDHLVVGDGDVQIILTVLRTDRHLLDVSGRVERSSTGEVAGEVVLVVPDGPLRAARLASDGSFRLTAVGPDVAEIWYLGHDIGFRCPVALGRA